MKRIIVVDDDPGLQEALGLIFDPLKYEVIILPNGGPILNHETLIPDLYILDKQLSGVDGLDICRFLKSEAVTRHVPVIILSASPDIYRLAQLAGADDALEKPFSIQDLRNLANKYLDNK